MITLYAKQYQIVIETNLICDVIIINNKIRHSSFTIFTIMFIFTTRRVLHTDPYFLQNIFILSVWPLRGHLAARGVTRSVLNINDITFVGLSSIGNPFMMLFCSFEVHVM